LHACCDVTSLPSGRPCTQHHSLKGHPCLAFACSPAYLYPQGWGSSRAHHQHACGWCLGNVCAGALRSRLKRGKSTKAVVFLSTCDGVDFLHALLTRSVAGQPNGADGSESDGGGDTGSGGAAALLGSAEVSKLHGDMPQAQRTASFLRFSQVGRQALHGKARGRWEGRKPPGQPGADGRAWQRICLPAARVLLRGRHTRCPLSDHLV
jgi:hypothetical protein